MDLTTSAKSTSPITRRSTSLAEVSNENRFDAAYKAIMQLANAALQASGYRTLTSKPGHHMTMIQSLPKTIALDTDTVIVLDTLRKQRNVADYSGDTVPESAMKECFLNVSSQDILQREINPKVYTQKEWKRLLAKKDGFGKEVMKQPKLFIIGTKDELGQSSREDAGKDRT